MSTASPVRRPMEPRGVPHLPEIDEKPYLEFIDGKVEAKVSPQKKHSLIATRLPRCLDDYAMPTGLGCTFVELLHVRGAIHHPGCRLPAPRAHRGRCKRRGR